ncbi:acyltransferase family protein [Nonlabens xiamenensis]|uniref:acyltransferase family protein n=1 Tax=Nonlabens xiamenensis TaxID=2341043 RepID=UPI000F6057E2|nr:acyltransferase family protein [Nonlabens xiamenensis]
MTNQRRYDIDAIRVIAIGLLIVYHIAIIFQPWAMFFGFIRSDEWFESLWKPMALLNVWRIPLLFYVSGMAIYFAMRKRNWQEIIKERSIRILLPFTFGYFVITTIHTFIFQYYYDLPLSYTAHTGHLWFLGNIFLYVLLLLPLFHYLKNNENGRIHRWLSAWMGQPWGPLSITIFFVAESWGLNPQIFAVYALTWHGFFLGLLAFFFGFLFVYSGKSFWLTVLKWRYVYLGVACTLFAVRWSIFALEAPNYLMAIESNIWIFTIFGWGYKYLNRPSKILSYLSPAVYPVYMIHMFVLYGAAYFILPLDIPVALQFAAVTLLTFIVCFLLYEFVLKRIGFLRPLFGLKWTTKAKPKDSPKVNLVRPELMSSRSNKQN